MNDTTKKERLRVSTEGTAGPYISVPFFQLDDLVKLLSDHHIHHTVDEYAISLDDGPEMVDVDLGRDGDAKLVQRILDSHG